MPRSEIVKILLTAGLLAASGLALIQSGVRLPAILLSAAGFTALIGWFIRKPPPERELPSASVSCCHYLQDHKDDKRAIHHGGKDCAMTREIKEDD
jgi:hypothetical protein